MADEEHGINRASHASDDPKNPLIQDNNELKFSHIAGVIEAEDRQRMKKLLFRATKGTTLVVFSDFESSAKDITGKDVQKTAYFVTFQDVAHIRSRVIRICESFNGQRFDLPPAEALSAKLTETRESLKQSDALRKKSRGQLKSYLEQINNLNSSDAEIAQVSQLEILKWYVAKEKSLYQAMNQFKQNGSVYIGYFWTPSFEKDTLF